jgi:hypothetical protein
MLIERRKAAHEVAEKLFEFEAAIDQALVCAGKLAASMPEARMNAKLSAVVGQDAIGMVGDALASLYAARAQTVAAHNSLAEVHQQIGLKVYASGMLWKTSESNSPPLSIVRTIAA